MLISATEPPSFRVVMQRPSGDRLLPFLLWAGCGAAAGAAAAVLVLPLGGGMDRLEAAALPFAVAAAACALLALWPNVERLLSVVLYVVSALALTYGLMVAASLPIRLTLVATCTLTPASACPSGFEPPMTRGETLGLDVAAALGVAALVLILCAMEIRHRPRLRILKARGAPAQPTAAPAPQMKPSAIVKSGVDESVNGVPAADQTDTIQPRPGRSDR